MSVQETPSMPNRSSGTRRRLLWAGIIAPLLFAATFLIDGALKPGYSAANEAISYLEVGAYGWIQQANFLLFGLLLFVFLIGYARRLRPVLGRGWLLTGCIFLALSDLGWMLAGLFIPNTFLAPQFGWPVILHQIAFNTVFLPLTIAWLILGLRCLFIRRWRLYGGYTFLLGLPLCAFSVISVINLLNPALVAGLIGNVNTPPPGDGLTNRVVLLIGPIAWYLITATVSLLHKDQPVETL